MTEQSTANRSQWERFTRTLLTTTCLGVAASGAAQASVIAVEGTSPMPADFSDTAPGYALPFGTDIVRGVLHSGVDTSDWFEFVDLKPGTAFSLQGTYNPFGQERGVSFQVFNSSSVQLGSATLEGAGRTIHGTVPVDGKLLVDVHFAQFGNPSYQFALTAETVPEPAVGWGAGLAVAAALAWKRKRDAGA